MVQQSQNTVFEMTRLTQEMFFNPVISMQRHMNQALTEMIGELARLPAAAQEIAEKVMPKVDVWEDSKAFYLETKVPGMAPEDIDVSVSDNTMTITCGSEKTTEQAEKGETLYEKRSACRTVMIPGNTEPDKASAEVRGEALLITLPKKKTAGDKSRKIPVRQAA